MTHPPAGNELLGPFVAHACFCDPDPARPPRLLSTFEPWNLVVLPVTTLASPPYKQKGICCTEGLQQMSTVVRAALLGDDLSSWLGKFRNHIRPHHTKNAAQFDSGDIVEISGTADHRTYVVISCRDFHRHLSHPLGGRGWNYAHIDSVVAVELCEMTETELATEVELAVWVRETRQDSPRIGMELDTELGNGSPRVGHRYVGGGEPTRLALSALPARSLLRLGRVTPTNWTILRQDFLDLLGA